MPRVSRCRLSSVPPSIPRRPPLPTRVELRRLPEHLDPGYQARTVDREGVRLFELQPLVGITEVLGHPGEGGMAVGCIRHQMDVVAIVGGYRLFQHGQVALTPGHPVAER